MLQFAAIIRPSADECLKLPCLALATAAPAAMKRPRSESVSTNKSVASVPVKPPSKDYWKSTRSSVRHKPRRARKRGPLAPPVPKFKVHKAKHHLPTPYPTPQKARKVLKTEEEDPEDAGMAKGASSPVSWDEMSVSD